MRGGSIHEFAPTIAEASWASWLFAVFEAAPALGLLLLLRILR